MCFGVFQSPQQSHRNDIYYMNEKQNEKPVPELKKKRLGDYTARELNEMPIEERQRLFSEAFLRNLSKDRPEG